MGLFSDIGKVSEKVWSQMPLRDKIALITSPVPFLGTATGVFADSITMGEDPSALNAGFLASNFIPGARIARAIGKTGKGLFTKNPAKEQLNKALHELPNFAPGFYGGGPLGQAFGATVVGTTGLKNALKSTYSPKYQGLWEQFGASVTDISVAKRYKQMLDGKYNPNIFRKSLDELEAFVMGKGVPFKKIPVKGIDKKDLPTDFNPFRYEKADISKDAHKKIMGQINQSRLFNEQYGIQSDFYKLLNGMDQIDYAKLGAKEYDTLMEGATGLGKTDLETVFKHIGMKGIQNVNPNKNYRMALRRPNTNASGNAERVLSGLPKVFGGTNINGLKKVFGGVFKGKKEGWDLSNSKVFNTDKEFLESLKKAGVGVRNPEEVLKGKPAIVTGSLVSDAYELGGVNYMTAIKKDGRLVSFLNDENDIFKIKAPLADRMISVSTPIVYDLLGKARHSGTKASKEALSEGYKKVRSEVESVMSKFPGVDISASVPSANTSKAQWLTIQALAGMEKVTDPSARSFGRTAALMNQANAVKRAANPIVGQIMERDDRRGLFPQ